jgi:hypothetical protein
MGRLADPDFDIRRQLRAVGDQVSVRLQYTHDLMTGPWLVPLFSGHRSVTLTSQIVMRRE